MMMMTETIRSRSNREIGEEVEGKTILEKKVVIAPDPVNKRLGVYDYTVAVSRQDKKPPAASSGARSSGSRSSSGTSSNSDNGEGGSTRLTPEERGIGLIRRLGSR
jgi:hypothetical protein